MKNVLTLLFLFLSVAAANGQAEKIDALIKEGLALHDKGDYAGAIEKYKKVLAYDQTSDLMNYEIAFSYTETGNYVKALEHADIVINGKGQSQQLAVILKGQILDDQGKFKEADAWYKKALKQYHDQHLLLLNYGIRCMKREEYDKAEQAFLDALYIKPNHPGSHLSMAYLQLKRGLRMEGILGLYFFLMLENNTPRAAEALTKLMDNLDIPQPGRKLDSTQINLNIAFPVSHEKLSRTDLGELSIYLITTMDAELNRSKDQWGLLVYDTNKIFSILGELQAQGIKGVEDYWWRFYVPLFYQLKTEGHAETFAWYIASASKSPQATAWLGSNKEKVDAFAVWLKKQ